MMLSHDDLCRLARLFGDGCNLRLMQDYRINEWLKDRLTEAKRRQECDEQSYNDLRDRPGRPG